MPRTDRVLDRFRLDDQVTVVTGGAKGIGAAVARAFLDVGARVAIIDRDGPAAAQLKRELAQHSPSLAAYDADVGDEAAVAAAFGAIVQDFGRIDVLVNNAGIAIRKPAVELSLDDWNRVVAVNMTGAFLCAREAARTMLRFGSGRIVNVASIMGLSGGGLYPNISYQTTKGALVNMTRALAVEWAKSGIRVNAVAPTYVRTEFIRPLLDQPELVTRIEAMTPLGRLAEPEDIVGAVLFLSSAASEMVTGHTLAVDGGFLAQ